MSRQTAAVLVIALSMVLVGQHSTARGEQEQTDQHQMNQTRQSNLEDCRAAMQTITKEYKNALYAVQRARNSGARAYILDAANDAQMALDAMEQPLKVCTDAMQVVRAEREAKGDPGE